MCRKLICLVSFVLVLGVVAVASGKEGLLGEYYHGSAGDPWQTLVMERVDPTVDFNWGSGSPDPSVNSNNFTVRWTGMIEVPGSATYTFHTQSDDGIRLWVNNVQIINNWTDHSNTHDSGDIALTGGLQYEIMLEYYDAGGDAVCELSWSTPTLTREAIPSQYLSVERSYARRPDPADGTILRETWVSLEWTAGDYAVSHDVYFGDNFDDVNDGTGETFYVNQGDTYFVVGFPGFPYPDGLVPGTTYYWRIDEVDPSNTYKGNVWSFAIAPKTAFDPDPADGAEFVDPNAELSWEPGFGAMLHYVYFGDNFNDVNDATGGPPSGVATHTPGPLELERVYYWRVDEFDRLATHKGDVWSFTTPGAIGSPNPPNDATDARITPTLSWNPGDSAASHQVYFGSDEEVVRNADTTSPEYKGTKALGAEKYDPGKLEWDTTYYWRVDEVNNLNPDSPWVGNVWSFTTADFLTVDDFEDYNDYPPDEIWSTWVDGYGIPANGATVGYPDPDWYQDEHYVEIVIVHGGRQSMPYFYDNALGNSEATMTLVSVRDWTENGVSILTIWFSGDASNAAVPMYVVLNGSAVVYHDNPNAAQIDTWTEWTIDLQAFADQGVNLTNVNSIGIGFGDRSSPQAGGSGVVYFDDIRLYRSAPPEPEPQP